MSFFLNTLENNFSNQIKIPGKLKKWRALYDFKTSDKNNFLQFHKNEVIYDIQPVNDRLWLGRQKRDDGTFSKQLFLPSQYAFPFDKTPFLLQQSGTFIVMRSHENLAVEFSTNPLSPMAALNAVIEAKWIEASTSTNFNTLRPFIHINRDVNGRVLRPKIQLFLGKIVDIHRHDSPKKIMSVLEEIGHHVYAALVSHVRWKLYFTRHAKYVGKYFDNMLWVKKSKLFPRTISNIDIYAKVKEIMIALEERDLNQYKINF
jgi:hypothetical protein